MQDEPGAGMFVDSTTCADEVDQVSGQNTVYNGYEDI